MINDFVSAGIQSDYYEENGKLPFGRLIFQHYLNAQPEDIVYIATGEFFSIFLNKSGKVFVRGSNHFGECDIPPIDIPIVKVVAGHSHVLVLGKNGDVVGWGFNSKYRLPFEPIKSIDIACTNLCSVFLDVDRRVRVYGNDQSISSLKVENAIYINALGNSCLAILSDSTLLCWGKINFRRKIKGIVSAHFLNDKIVVLKDDGKVYLYPEGRRLKFNNIVYVSSSYNNFFALNDIGKIFAYGYNFFGQMCPPDGENYSMVAAGPHHGIALKNGKVLSWGSNYYHSINF
ncbi:MAG: hypothetical protein SNJ71_02090 [Bacteroidales bacterium]